MSYRPDRQTPKIVLQRQRCEAMTLEQLHAERDRAYYAMGKDLPNGFRSYPIYGTPGYWPYVAMMDDMIEVRELDRRQNARFISSGELQS